MRESRVVPARSRLRCGDGNSSNEPALSFLFCLSHLRLALVQKVVPKTLFAAPFRKEALHPWADAQRGVITPVIVVFLAAEPADTIDTLLVFHFWLCHACHAPLSFKSILWGFEKREKRKPMRFPSLSLSELVGNLGEQVVGVDGVVDKRRSALVMDASAKG